jgi:sirohydrochlorin cobaltochelatase
MGLHLGDEIPEQIGIPPYSEGGDITVNGRKISVYYGRPVEADNRLTDYLDMRAAEYLS